MATTSVPSSDSSTGTERRPFSVTLLVVCGYLAGALSVLSGVLLFGERDDPRLLAEAGTTSGVVTALAVAVIAFGGVKILLANLLGKGSNVVRVVFGVLAVFSLASGVWALFSLFSEQRVAGTAQAAVAIVVLYLLFNSRASEFFERT